MTPKGRVALSTTSTYPESTAAAFEIAARLGYDGVEVMVWTDPVSQDVDALRRLSDYHGVPVLSVHSPCLLVTQRVWGTDPWAKLTRARQAAERLGASTVVVHPPFRWQSTYAQEFVAGIARMADETDVRFAVENMYPWRAAGREFQAYLPDWDPTPFNYDHVTLDLSHTAVSGQDALAAVSELGDRLAHLHLADGTGSNRDEHLVPGRGNEPTAEVLELLATRGFEGTIVLEVSTRKAANRAEREADLAESLAYARLHFAAPPAGAEPAAAPAAGRAGAVPIDLRRGRPRLAPPGAQVGDPTGGRPAGVPNGGPAPASPAPDDVDATPKGPAARAREALAAAWAAAEFGSPEPAADPSPGTTSAPRRPLGPSASLIALAADRRRARRGEPEDTAAELYGSPSDLHRP